MFLNKKTKIMKKGMLHSTYVVDSSTVGGKSRFLAGVFGANKQTHKPRKISKQ